MALPQKMGQEASVLLAQANALKEKGQLQQALAITQTAFKLAPHHAQVHNMLGVIQQALKQYAKALDHYLQAHKLDDKDPVYIYNIAMIMAGLGKHEEAVQCYMTSLMLNKHNAAAFKGMGDALAALGRYEEAILAYKRALKIKPNDVDAMTHLAITYNECGQYEHSIPLYKQALALEAKQTTHSNYVFSLNYVPNNHDQLIYEAHRDWAKAFAGKESNAQNYTNKLNSARKIRLGFVSAHFKRHSMTKFFMPFFEHLNRQLFEVYIYSTTLKGDDLTRKIYDQADHWHDMLLADTQTLVNKIKQDAIDILVDLDGHEGGKQLLAFAQKPAPIQVSWLGYFNTTGLKAIDYFISDVYSSPHNLTQYFSEEIVRLPHTRFCYTPPKDAPKVAKLPALKNGYITFGCFNNLAKINDQVIALWAKILLSVPNSRLVLKARALNDEASRNWFAVRFAEHGIEASRLAFRPYSKNIDLYREYGDIDIALDPFPFTGAVTTCDSIWNGVPVITLAGTRLVARQGVAFLSNLNLQDWIANTEDEYLAIAIQKASNLEALAQLRAGLRTRMTNSRICDGQAFARDLESAFATMWAAWCERQSKDLVQN